MRPGWLAALACLALLLGAPGARAAFAVPAIEGHVTDAAHVLSFAERADLEQRLTRSMDQRGVEIAVFVAGSLGGETIEDVAYETFNSWRVGRDKLDNGVLLVIAPQERRVRIETGKGIGGQLTDLQASDIIDNRIAPRLREGRYHDAIADGCDAIAEILASSQSPAQKMPKYAPFAFIALLILFVLVRLVFFRGRRVFFWGGPGGGGFGSGGGGGGGYSGGGGRSGGGGASGGW